MNTPEIYDVVIIGGGPVGVALGIELGINDIRTLVLEKHAAPLRLPRAQSLSARTMEFFTRWGIDRRLEDRLLLPQDLPQTGIWCSSLCGETYYVGCWGDNKLDEHASPKAGVRVPIWITEDVLRQRLTEFPSVDFLINHEVRTIQKNKDHVLVEVFDSVNHSVKTFKSRFLACCDGTSGQSRQQLNNAYEPLSDVTRMVGTLFTSKQMMAEKTVADGIMYFVISDDAMAFVGPIDLNEGLWLAQIVWSDHTSTTPDHQVLSAVIDKLMGKPLNDKKIIDSYFWDMQVQVADLFAMDQHIFWVGDAAHAFAPTGGLGLNTGFGDAQNLGWKLAAVIKNEADVELLNSYEIERRPICLNNLQFAKQNAEEFIEMKNQFPHGTDPHAFARAYADLGDRYLSSSGLTLGYGYLHSPLTLRSSFDETPHDPFRYVPKAEPGYFLPHTMQNGKPIYEQLSPSRWTLLVSHDKKTLMEDLEPLLSHFSISNIEIKRVTVNSYPSEYVLIRPDWHIAWLGQLEQFIQEKNRCDLVVS